MSWWETLDLVTWWKRLGISAIKTGQDAPSWIWCTERLSFLGGGHIVLQRFVHVQCHFQPPPTKLVFAYFDRGSYVPQSLLHASNPHVFLELNTMSYAVPWVSDTNATCRCESIASISAILEFKRSCGVTGSSPFSLHNPMPSVLCPIDCWTTSQTYMTKSSKPSELPHEFP